MALVTVSTFAEFLTAIQVTGDTVMLANDLDANGYIFTTTKAINANVDGNGHTIYNLQNDGGNNAIFSITLGMTVKNCNFYNIYCSWSLFYSNGIYLNPVVITNCNFQGRVGYFLSGSYANISYCAINLSATNMRMFTGSYNSAIQCYFNHGETATTQPENGSTNWFYGNTNKFIDCYFGGKIHITTTGGHQFIASDGTSKNCVINVDVDYQGVSSGTFTIGSGFSNGTGISIFNNTKITTTLNNSAGNTQMYPLTDTEMKDRDSIAAVGFPIL